jgi:hypothetical protein
MLWEKAHSYNSLVCGQYLTMWDLYQAKLSGLNPINIDFPVIIGFDDLLPFQTFGDSSFCVLGDFKLIIRVSPDALVWCMVDSEESIRQMSEIFSFTQNESGRIFDYKKFAAVISSNNQQNNYNHRFTQVNSS